MNFKLNTKWNYTTETALIDNSFIDQMINRCYTINQYVIIRDLGLRYAKLQYGECTYRNTIGEYTEEKKLKELKSIFQRLIYRHQSFEHEGYRYYYSRGSWAKMKV
ncbi:hypothetical protein [Aquimarina aggregata]|uniref:hypothetical protein n=1 Tax=Aquimarina aggregata TaxID=1642818 RepID=UPI002492947E|nr:hypothetical protein [Aquimarina aggregata]